jgi:carbamoyltransferase
MIVWGVSANSHDAALAVFKDNQLLFASHSERFTRIKNDPDLSAELISYAINYFGYPDELVWYEKPWAKTLRQLKAGQGFSLRSNNIKHYLKKFNINIPFTTEWHHESHAAAGFYTSSFKEAAVVVIDAIGEFETLTIWKTENKKLKKIYSQWYPHSLGLWYSSMTQRIALKPNEEEYILMGMAAYGDPDKLYHRIQEDFFKNNTRLVELKSNLHRGCKNWAPELQEKDYFDVAAATQKVYEYYFDKIIKQAKTLTNSENLVLMGGCALNCSANPIAYRYFKRIWIMPNPGDAGSSIGAVLSKTKKHIPWSTSALGYYIEPKSSTSQIVDWLHKHKICGVAQGRAEFGPRALGNRSLLADPRGKSIKEMVNTIKQRQQFRPFSPMILEELANDYFEILGKPSDHRYMQFISRCKFPEQFPAIVHYDGTSRVQTIPKGYSRIRKLLEQWYDKTGCPILLNTSLNIKGQPMINDIEQARTFEKIYSTRVFT